jgi:hypothetical protein
MKAYGGVDVMIHALAALPPGTEPQVPIGQETGWAPESGWTICRKENSWPYWDSNYDPLVIHPVLNPYTYWATVALLKLQFGSKSGFLHW